MNEKTECDIVIGILTELMVSLIDEDAQGNLISDVVFSPELNPAIYSVVFKNFQLAYVKRGEHHKAKLMESTKEQLIAMFAMGICAGFNLSQKESPMTYADDFVRRECEKRDVDFQTFAERIIGREE